jgi:hypothetical protein
MTTATLTPHEFAAAASREQVERTARATYGRPTVLLVREAPGF